MMEIPLRTGCVMISTMPQEPPFHGAAVADAVIAADDAAT
jgi:hypothetical protein